MTDVSHAVEPTHYSPVNFDRPNTDLVITRLQDKFSDARVRSWRRGETIYRQAQPANEIHLVYSGMVKLMSHLQCGKSRIVRLMGEGDVLASESLLANSYQHSAVALFETTTYAISASEFRQKFETDREVVDAVIAALYMSQRKADQWITDFSTGTAKVRVARLLQYLTLMQPGFQESDEHKLNLLSVQDTADILGVTIESASRIIAAFKREKLLNKIKGRTSKGDAAVYQLDNEGLMELLN